VKFGIFRRIWNWCRFSDRIWSIRNDSNWLRTHSGCSVTFYCHAEIDLEHYLFWVWQNSLKQLAFWCTWKLRDLLTPPSKFKSLCGNNGGDLDLHVHQVKSCFPLKFIELASWHHPSMICIQVLLHPGFCLYFIQHLQTILMLPQTACVWSWSQVVNKNFTLEYFCKF
jgi:hypothetical protein